MASQELVSRALLAVLSFGYKLLVGPFDWRSLERDDGQYCSSHAFIGANVPSVTVSRR